MLKKLFAPLVLGIAGCIVLIALFTWQLERLAWKENLIEETKAAMAEDPKPLDASEDFDQIFNGKSGEPFRAVGKITQGYTDKLSGAGYNRIFPFQIGPNIIMVELGFVPQEDKELQVEMPKDEITIIGRAYFPNSKGSLDEARNIWVGYDSIGMAKKLGTLPFLLIADESPIEGIKSSPYTIDLPNNHLQYAITWALLALVWAGMTVYWGYSRIRKLKTR